MNVGIDIEKVEPIDLTIAKNYFAQAEYQYIMKDNNEQAQLNRFFEVWTLKECYMFYFFYINTYIHVTNDTNRKTIRMRNI